jgi:hypothetical protein
MVAHSTTRAKCLKDCRRDQKQVGPRWTKALINIIKVRYQPGLGLVRVDTGKLYTTNKGQRKTKPQASSNDSSNMLNTKRNDSVVPHQPTTQDSKLRASTTPDSSSSPLSSSSRGVCLLLAVVSAKEISTWEAKFGHLCHVIGGNITDYYSSIQYSGDSARIKVFADCETRVIASVLKRRLRGQEVNNKQLICKII